MARKKKEKAEDPFTPLDGGKPAEEIKPDFNPDEAMGEFLGGKEKDDGDNGSLAIPKVPDRYAGIVEHSFNIDVEKEYRRLDQHLELGPKRSDIGAVLEALDAVERNTVIARRIHRASVIALEQFELDVREREATFREAARQALEQEKAAGSRKKTITISDVEDYCIENFGDEWRSIAERRAQLKGVVEVLDEMTQSYRSRQATVRMLAKAAAPNLFKEERS